MDKFREVIPLSRKVVTANTVNFRPILEFSLLKKIWGTPVPDQIWVSKPLPFSSVCNNLRGQRPLGAEIWPFKEVEFRFINIRRVSSEVSGPEFTRFLLSNVGGLWLITPFSACRCLHPCQRYSRLKSEAVENRAEFGTNPPTTAVNQT